MTALRELIEAVEAGTARGQYRKLCDKIGIDAVEVMRADLNGSLDAACALHEAVLPGWGWSLMGYGASHVGKGEVFVTVRADNPARAWLLCILKALEAALSPREEGK